MPLPTGGTVLQDAARRAHQRLASEENRQLIAEKAQRAFQEEQYSKDVTRHEQETEVAVELLLLLLNGNMIHRSYPMLHVSLGLWKVFARGSCAGFASPD